VYVSVRRDIAAAPRFFTTALVAHGKPDEVVTDGSAALANVIEKLLPSALHNALKYLRTIGWSAITGDRERGCGRCAD
jgi:transposase-like protein